jgi:hypothetical protein
MSNEKLGSGASKNSIVLGDETVLFRRDRYSNRGDIVQAQKVFFEAKARMAAILVEKWGMVAVDVDGEDSSGRSKARILTPDEVVSRACTTADLAYREFERRGWAHEIPMSLVTGEESDES